MFVAIINTPGYLPDNDVNANFDNASEAWEYLAEDRRIHEDEMELTGYSETVNVLEELATGTMDAYANAGVSEDGTGVVYGDTPGYDGIHDLGIAYSVQVAE